MVIYRSSELIIFRNSRATKRIQTGNRVPSFFHTQLQKDRQKLIVNRIIFRIRLIFNYVMQGFGPSVRVLQLRNATCIRRDMNFLVTVRSHRDAANLRLT